MCIRDRRRVHGELQREDFRRQLEGLRRAKIEAEMIEVRGRAERDLHEMEQRLREHIAIADDAARRVRATEDSLGQVIAAREAEIQNLRAKLLEGERAMGLVAELRDRNDFLERELAALRERLAAAEQGHALVAELEGRLAHLQQENMALRRANEDLHLEIEAAQARVHTLEAEAGALDVRLKEAEVHSAGLKGELGAVQHRRAEEESRYRLEIASLREKIVALESSTTVVGQYESRIQQMVIETDRLGAVNSQLTSENSLLRARLAEVESQLSIRIQQASQDEEKLRLVEAKVTEMESRLQVLLTENCLLYTSPSPRDS
eukprot:TRINITY_DN5823_c0_g3_i3.p1 TRINITY_DN5823_c0_g3~~TRINITY_DN5823_c0_g3_i3.p1  ORF type:complete len:320 (+),score=100.33 TRINITY_DN5823_c0_g3_i3:65-1024(+)